MMEKRYITGRRGEVSTERAMVDYVSKCVGGDQIQDSIDSVVKAAGDHDVANFMDRRQDEIDPHATGISEEQRQQIKMEYGDDTESGIGEWVWAIQTAKIRNNQNDRHH